MDLFRGRIDQVSLVFELPVGVDHDSMGLNCDTFNPFNLTVCLLQIIDSVEQALSVSLPQLHIGALKVNKLNGQARSVISIER